MLINNEHLLLTVLEASKSNIKGAADLVFSEGQLPGSLCPHMAEGEGMFSGVSFIRALIPLMRAPPL